MTLILGSTLSGSAPSGSTSVTTGVPLVIVPVLSSTAMVISAAFSSAALLLNKMPFSAPRPMPTMMAVGVANPSAHGQAMTSTEIALISACSNDT